MSKITLKGEGDPPSLDDRSRPSRPHDPSLPAHERQWLLLVCLLFSLPVVVFFLSPVPHILSIGLVEDDAFYYLKVATQVAAGQGSTFDGISPTNGYHPLWLVCLLPVYLLQGANAVLAFRLACLLCLLLYLGATIIAHRLFRRAFLDWTSAAFGLITTCFLTFFSSNYCMEAPLVLFVTWGTVLYIARKDPFSPTAPPLSDWCLGLLLALAFLSRLDLVFLGMLAAGATAFRGLREGASLPRIWGKLLRLLLPCVLLPAPYLAWNLHRFGHLMPISGFLKSSFPRPALHFYVLTSLGPHVLFASLVGVVLLLKVAIARPDRRTAGGTATRPRVEASLALLAGSILLQVLYAFLFEKWGFAHWQMASTFLLTGFGVGWMIEALSGLARRWVGAGPPRSFAVASVLLALAAAVGTGIWFRLLPFDPRSFFVHEWEAALWTREHLPENAILAAKADAGLFAYFSQRRVININDGLVGDFAYQEVLKEERLASYLSDRGVGWLFLSVDPALERDGRFAFRALSHRYDSYSDEISVDVAAAPFRSPTHPVAWGSGQIYLVITPFARSGSRQ